MDLITQGAMGAVAAQAISRDRKQVALATLCGALAGFAPDLDVLIRSETDPLLYLEYHRHFTHALAFIPVGGALVAGVITALGRRWWQLSFLQVWLFCTVGLATHGLIDAATSYGTSLLWPFAADRISWSLVSIIDPFVTLPVLVLIVMAAVRRRPIYARLGVGWVFFYMAFAGVQHQRALDVAKTLADDRGHAPLRVEVKPSFGNSLVWRSIYELPDRFYVDAIRTGVTPSVFPGTSIAKLNVADDLPWLAPNSQQALDIGRFAFFSDGYVAADPGVANRIIDIRYSFVPNKMSALWSIQLSPDAPETTHARYLTHRGDARSSLGVLWQMVKGAGEGTPELSQRRPAGDQ